MLYSKILYVLWQSKESGLSYFWKEETHFASQIKLFVQQRSRNQNNSINLVGYLQKFASNGLITAHEVVQVKPIAFSFSLLLGIVVLYIVLMILAFVVFSFEKRLSLIAALVRLSKYWKEKKNAFRLNFNKILRRM